MTRAHAAGFIPFCVMHTERQFLWFALMRETGGKKDGRRRGHRSCGGLIKRRRSTPLTPPPWKGGTQLSPMRGMAAGNYKSSINKRNSCPIPPLPVLLFGRCELLFELLLWNRSINFKRGSYVQESYRLCGGRKNVGDFGTKGRKEGELNYALLNRFKWSRI